MEAEPRGPYRRLLHNRNFLLLWGAAGVSACGDAFFDLAILWVVYTRTGSILQAAGVTIAESLGKSLMAPVAGALVDRWDRRRTLIASDCLRAAIAGTLAFLTWREDLSTAVAIGGVFALTLVAQFFGPARGALWPEIVGTEDLVTSNGLRQTTYNGANLAGNALAGVVIAASGALWAFIADAISFVASAFGALLLRPDSPEPPSVPRTGGWRAFWNDVAGGWHVVVTHPTVRIVMLFLLLSNFASFSAVIPALVRVQLHGGAAIYGLLQSASIVGAVVAGLLVGPADRWLGTGRLIVGAGVGIGLCFLGVGLSRSVPLTAALLGLAALGGSIAPIPALYQSFLPGEYLGRAFALLAAAHTAASPLGALLFGWLGDAIGPGRTVVLAGLWGLAAGMVVLFSPAVRRVRVTA